MCECKHEKILKGVQARAKVLMGYASDGKEYPFCESNLEYLSNSDIPIPDKVKKQFNTGWYSARDLYMFIDRRISD